MTSVVLVLYLGILMPAAILVALTALPASKLPVRVFALSSAGASSASAFLLFTAGSWSEWTSDPVDVVLIGSPGSGDFVRVDALSLPLFPMVGLIWLCGLAIAPRLSFSARSARRSALAYLAMVLAFSSTSPELLAGLIVVSSLVFLSEHHALVRVYRVAATYLATSSLLLVGGVVLLRFGGRWDAAAVWLIIAALLIRKGIVPVHSWMPESFERGHLVPAILFNTPQVGAYAIVVIVLPVTPAGTLEFMATAALLTTLYGAMLAVVESDTRRAFGYLFMSQSALVLVGLGTGNEDGVAGTLAVWMAAGLSMSGLGLTIAALELRRGRLSLRDHHGGYEQMPLLAASFLIFGLASVGFPGTLGFLGEELLVAGIVGQFPYVGFIVIAAVALNGVTVLKMYFSLFCGTRLDGVSLALRGRETAAFATLAVILVVGGLFPKHLVESRIEAARVALSHPAPTDTHIP